jgi:hypothetical protein
MARSMQHMWPSAMLELHHTLQGGLSPFPALLIAGQVFSNATASGPREATEGKVRTLCYPTISSCSPTSSYEMPRTSNCKT